MSVDLVLRLQEMHVPGGDNALSQPAAQGQDPAVELSELFVVLGLSLGDEEAAQGAVKLRNMETREERTVPQVEAAEAVRGMIGE